MICDSCREAAALPAGSRKTRAKLHKKCAGGSRCVCQHRIGANE